MKIGPVPPHNRPDQSAPTGKPNRTAKQDSAPAQQTDADTVEISREAREKLARMAEQARQEQLDMTGGRDTETQSASTDKKVLADGKLEQIRLKILSGYYAQQKIQESIADRLSRDIDLT